MICVHDRTFAACLAVSVLLSLHCSQTPEQRRASIYEIVKDPTEENQQRIRDMLSDPDRDVRATALNMMVTLGAPDVEKLVLEGLEDEDGFVRSIAAKLIGDLGNPQHAGGLVEHLLRDSNPWVRQRAAESLAELEGSVAVQGLAWGLEDPLENVRLAAVTGLRKLEPGYDKPAMARLLLDDPVWEIRVQAARALGSTGDEDIRQVLEAALKDQNEFVRSAASHALKIHERVSKTPPAS